MREEEGLVRLVEVRLLAHRILVRSIEHIAIDSLAIL